jgi:hypothetical protein
LSDEAEPSVPMATLMLGDEVPVHDVHVDEVGPSALHGGYIPAQVREVR